LIPLQNHFFRVISMRGKSGLKLPPTEPSANSPVFVGTALAATDINIGATKPILVGAALAAINSFAGKPVPARRFGGMGAQ
jgi:hypothetical protein